MIVLFIAQSRFHFLLLGRAGLYREHRSDQCEAVFDAMAHLAQHDLLMLICKVTP
nr:hypothetical protein [Rhizobium leguminosarum]